MITSPRIGRRLVALTVCVVVSLGSVAVVDADPAPEQPAGTTTTAPSPTQEPGAALATGPSASASASAGAEAGAEGEVEAGDLRANAGRYNAPSDEPGDDPVIGPSGRSDSLVTNSTALSGIDVASWQHPSGAAINWPQVAASGQSFAIVKATGGGLPRDATTGACRTEYTNPWFASDFQAALDAGMYRAAYHYACPQVPVGSTARAHGASEARFFFNVLGVRNGLRDLPPVLDLEESGGLDPAQLIEWTRGFLDEMRRLSGRTPMIYTAKGFWTGHMANTTAFSDHPLWVASWVAAYPDPNCARSQTAPTMGFGGWTSWALWQWTDCGTVPGISARVDMNKACCGIGGLIALAGKPTLGFLRLSNSTGVADATVEYFYPAGGWPLSCDWDGNGIDSPSKFIDGRWYGTNSVNGGAPTIEFSYGQSGDLPICGDWDGDGTDTPGVFRRGVWYLTNRLNWQLADIVFAYGNPSGDFPVVGDWDGNGTDTPAVFRDGAWFVSNRLNWGLADLAFGYGQRWDFPISGDWDNDGRDSPGVKRANFWFLVDRIGQPHANKVLSYGEFEWPIPGRWYFGLPSTPGITRQTP